MIRPLRRRIEEGPLVLAPGVGDALGALLVEKAGFDCVSISGYQVAATLGYPDVGLATLSEMVAAAERISDAVSIPVIADADNGHGNAVNVIRTVREFERAGVSAVHLEDQALPKKCGHMSGHALVPTAEMCGKIRAAAEARRDRDFLIVARTDAIAAGGVEEAVRRGNAYRRAGADAVMVMAPRSVDDLRRFREGVPGPLVVTVGSWSFEVTAAELQELGYRVALFPLTTLRRSVAAVLETLAELRRTGFVAHAAPGMIPVHDLHHLLGLGKVQDWERRYAGALTEA